MIVGNEGWLLSTLHFVGGLVIVVVCGLNRDEVGWRAVTCVLTSASNLTESLYVNHFDLRVCVGKVLTLLVALKLQDCKMYIFIPILVVSIFYGFS